MTELERFMRDVDADEELAKRFGTVANRIALADDTLSESEGKARAMSELGYKVTATQLELAAAENELLDHDELELVAGGKLNNSEETFGCTGQYERGEIPYCWGKNQGCMTFYQD